MTDPLTFALAVIGLLAVPGPTNTLLATAGGLVGARRAWRLIPAELAGYFLAIGLVTAVLRPILSSHPSGATALRAIAALVLIVLAIGLWRGSAASAVPAIGERSIRPWQVFVTTLLNPKATVFALVIIPHLGGPTPQRALPYLAAFAVLLVSIACSWATLGSVLHGKPRISPTAVRRTGAVVLMLFATVLLGTIGWSLAE